MSPKNTPPDKQLFLTREKKIIILLVIPAVVFAIISCREGLIELTEGFNFSRFGAPINGAIITFLLLLFGLYAFFPLIRVIQKFFSALTGKYFVISLAALAVLGATAALYIPSYTNWFKPDTQQSTSGTQNGQGSGNQQNQSSKDPSSDLRLHLLYITGGIIAVLGLIETNRKNSQDHIREVHAARRDRYIKAVDKLSSDDAPVRLGGVYALVGLIDEWLDDDNIDEETRIKEGQIIINNLCSYIRSPFLTAEKIEAYEAHNDFNLLQEYEAEFSFEEYSPQLRALCERVKESGTFNNFQDITADYAKFHEEQDVRRAIFVEMSKRSSTFTKNEKGDMIPSRGTWSEFDFDFSRASIFYPLNHLTIEKGIFSYASFYGQADFNESTFIRDAAFNGVKFTQGANFTEVTFNGEADFSAQGDIKTVFGEKATFNGTQFKKTALFNKTIFNETDFSGSTINKTIFTMDAIFEGTEFTKNTSFNNVEFNGLADFSSHSQNLIQPITFGGNTEFIGTDFHGKANFMGVIAELESALNSEAPSLIFKKVNFKKEAIFTSAQINLNTVFENTHFHNSAEFEHAHFYDSVKFAENTSFQLTAKFLDSKFFKNLEVEARFKNGANFGMSQFGTENETQQKTTFRKTNFEGHTSFSDSDFYTPTDFIDINVQGETNFTDTRFHGTTSFNNSHSENVFKFAADAYFDRVKFKEPVDFIAIRFCNKVNFENAIFYKDSKFEDMYFDSFSPDFKDAEFEAKSNHSFTTKSNSTKHFDFGTLKPKSTGQPISLPRGSFLFTDTPGNQRIGPA